MVASVVQVGRPAGRALAVRVAVAAVIGGAGVFGATFVLSGGDAAGHAWSHLIGAVAAPLVAAVVALWRARSPVESATRLALIAALWLFAAAQAVEAIGAFGWEDDNVRWPVLQVLHDGALAVGIVPLLLAALALATALVLLGVRDVRRATLGGGSPMTAASGRLGVRAAVVAVAALVATSGIA